MIREKHRYLLVESVGEMPQGERELFSLLSREIMQCVGESNYHKINPKLMKIVNPKVFILKSTLTGISELILSMALIKRLDGKDCAFYTLKASGTIRALSKQ